MRNQHHRFVIVSTLVGASVLSTYWVGSGVLRLREVRSDLQVEQLAPGAPVSATKREPGAELGRQILARNIFDSQTGPMSWDRTREAPAPSPLTPPSAPTDLHSLPPPRCASPLRLLGSVVIAREPERSLAMMRWEGQTHILRVGGAIGEAQLVALRSARAYMQPADGPLCMLPLFLPASERPKVHARPTPAKGKVSAKKPEQSRARAALFSVAELDAAIQPAGRDRYRVARDFLDRALGKASGLAQGARFVPAMDQGRRVGMRMYRVRPDTLLHRLGVRNGDVLRSINGFTLSSADGLLQAYTQLRSRNDFELALYRRGRLATLAYSVE